MAVPVPGSFYSDLTVGAKVDVSEDLKLAVPGQTPYLNTTGFGSGGPATNLAHTYYDDSYVPLRTTVAGGGFNAAAVNITLATAIAKPGQRIAPLEQPRQPLMRPVLASSSWVVRKFRAPRPVPLTSSWSPAPS